MTKKTENPLKSLKILKITLWNAEIFPSPYHTETLEILEIMNSLKKPENLYNPEYPLSLIYHKTLKILNSPKNPENISYPEYPQILI